VPRSMPSAGRYFTLFRRALLWPGSAMFRRAMGMPVPSVERAVFDRTYFFGKALQELQLVIAALGRVQFLRLEMQDEAAPVNVEIRARLAPQRFHHTEVAAACRLFQAIALVHLGHQEAGIKLRLLRLVHVPALQFKQVRGPPERGFQRLVSIVDETRVAQCRRALTLVSLSLAVRMPDLLQRAVAGLELWQGHFAGARQVEHFKKIHHRSNAEAFAATAFALDVGVVELEAFVDT